MLPCVNLILLLLFFFFILEMQDQKELRFIIKWEDCITFNLGMKKKKGKKGSSNLSVQGQCKTNVLCGAMRGILLTDLRVNNACL